MSALRRDHPTFRRRRFFEGKPVLRGEGEPLQDIVWLRPSGEQMVPADWDSGFGRSIGVFLNGNGIRGRDDRGLVVYDDNFLLFFNAHDDTIEFTIPGPEYSPRGLADPGRHRGRDRRDRRHSGRAPRLPVPAKAMLVLRGARPAPGEHVVMSAVPAPKPAPADPRRRDPPKPPAKAPRRKSGKPAAKARTAVPEPAPTPPAAPESLSEIPGNQKSGTGSSSSSAPPISATTLGAIPDAVSTQASEPGDDADHQSHGAAL